MLRDVQYSYGVYTISIESIESIERIEDRDNQLITITI